MSTAHADRKNSNSNWGIYSSDSGCGQWGLSVAVCILKGINGNQGILGDLIAIDINRRISSLCC